MSNKKYQQPHTTQNLPTKETINKFSMANQKKIRKFIICKKKKKKTTQNIKSRSSWAIE
jgi:hypothetical protein